jgi:chromosome segregation ATPase
MRQALSGPPDTPEELLTALRNDRGRIDQTTDSMMKKIEAYNQARKPGERTIQFSEVFMEDLSGEQRDVLNQLLAEEKDVSYRTLLTNMISDRDTIRELQQKVLQLEQRLPDTFVVAKKGDSHTKLATNYLTTEAKLDPAKAKDMVGKIDRTDELLPGNHVWFFYDPNQDTFRTYVTQGEAGQTPLAVRRAQQRKLIAERDTARTERDQEHSAREVAEAEVASLETRKQQLESDIALLQQNKADLEANVDRLSRDLAFRQNSLFYHAENERSLKDRGVLSGVLAKVKDVKRVDYNEALDLRNGTSIALDPRTFGLERIRAVKVLPSIYQEGRDFAVETSEETGTARLVILDPDLFRGREVLLSVGG